MTKEEVVNLMMTSHSEDEWNANCDKVKAAYGGRYPDFWWEAIQKSGVAHQVINSWKETTP